MSWWWPLRHQALGNRARDRMDWSRAAYHYGVYLRNNPADAALWVQLGHVQKERGRLSAAAIAYQRALYMRPYDADLHLHVAHLHKRRREIPMAISALRRALELYPRFDAAREELRRLEADSVEPDDRTKTLETLIRRLERRIINLERLQGLAPEAIDHNDSANEAG